MKRQINNIHILWTPALIAVLLLTGCVKRELEYRKGVEPEPNEGIVDIALYWGEQKKHPASCRYLFYNEAGDLVKEVSGIAERYQGVLPAGKYRLVVHNTDASHVDYRGLERYEKAEVFALEASSQEGSDITPDSKSSTTSILEPQSVFGTGSCREFEVIEIIAGKTSTATVTPVPLTRQVKLLFKIVNSNNLQSLTGLLDGVTPSVYLATGAYNLSTSCTVPFAGKREEGAVDYLVELSIFNVLTKEDSPEDTNDIHVSLVEENGTPHDATFDLTETIQDIIQENGGEIPIEIPIEITLQLTEFGLTSTIGRWEHGSGSDGSVN